MPLAELGSARERAPPDDDDRRAKNGLEVLDRLDESEFDLILLDIHMPVLDGLQTLERIRGAKKSGKGFQSLLSHRSSDRGRLVQGAKPKLPPAISLSELDELFAAAESVPRERAAKPAEAKRQNRRPQPVAHRVTPHRNCVALRSSRALRFVQFNLRTLPLPYTAPNKAPRDLLIRKAA